MSPVSQVTIVICTYNSRIELERCLQSLEDQDYGGLELVVVNDASEDDTLEFLRQFESRTQVKAVVVTNPANLGVAGSRNVGIELASGDIIAFTDADCVADPRWISELIEGYAHQDVKAVGGRIFNKKTANIWELLDRRHNYVAAEEGCVSYLQGCNMSFTAEVARQFKFDHEIKYGFEETLLCNQLSDHGYRIYYRPQALVCHKPRDRFLSLWKQKYRRGWSSVWYRKKRGLFFMYKRHFILLLSLLCLPLLLIQKYFLILVLALFLVFFSSLIRDELKFRSNSGRDILVTSPFLVLIELAHFWGSLVGLVRFRILKTNKPHPLESTNRRTG